MKNTEHIITNNNTEPNSNWSKNTFLSHVCQDMLMRFNGNLSNVCVVFPNKRARLFMNEELLTLSNNPLWAPEYVTIGELFESIVEENVCESIPAVCSLYHVYKQKMGEKAEPLDRFWGWGEIILSDFDDIDKHLVEADRLFLNAKQLNEMESLDFLSDNQRKALTQFFSTTNNKTLLQERFIQLWDIMPSLYHGIREVMPENVQPYPGALERKAVENKEMLERLPQNRTYCFVGFNMLSETEKKLMMYLYNKNQAHFYWDYDVMYKDNPCYEAGDFIRQNIKLFPNALGKRNIYNNLKNASDFTYVATSTDSIATRYIPYWLKENLTETERETAIVLCDEQQLQTVLHSIPDTIENNIDDGGQTPDIHSHGVPKDVNITMGYSLVGTPIFSFIQALIALQTEGWDEKRVRFRMPFLRAIKYHPYSKYVDEEMYTQHISSNDVSALIDYLNVIIKILAQRVTEDVNFNDVLMTESLYTMHKTLMQFADMVTDSRHSLDLHTTTLRRLLRRVLSSQNIPFHGEPAQGLQIMGVLETRCLDFRHLLLLNVGEGFLPQGGADNSMIPYTLRVGFGLTTPRHRIAVYAYYFYRLIQRAERVTFIYNENSSGNVRHEMSRFLRQLQAETDIPIRQLRLEAEQDSLYTGIDSIPKDEIIFSKLLDMYDLNTNPEAHSLSPSAINRYLDCPMKFYLSTVCGLRDEPTTDEGVDPRLLGTIFHNCAERIYKEILKHSDGKILTRSHLSVYTKDKGKRLQNIIDEQFKKDADITDFRGENILIRGVVEKYLINLLKWDENHSPIEIEKLERDVNMKTTFNVAGKELCIKTGGRVDRMDIITDHSGFKRLRILDYKTGLHQDTPNSLNNLFSRGSSHCGYYLQTFLYAYASKSTLNPKYPIQPVLFYPAHAGKNEYDPSLHFGGKKGTLINDINEYEHDFNEALKNLLEEIFTPNTTFEKTTNNKVCEYCDFKVLCGRK